MKTGIRHKATGNSKKTNILGFALCAMLIAHSAATEAQQPKKVPRIGILWLSPSFNLSFSAFRKGLRDLGYIEGENISLEIRWAERYERLPDLATELVRLNVDVIFASGASGVSAAKQATKTIPIVFVAADPVGAGFVASLARPGGNITGLSIMLADLSGKQLELLKEAIPGITRVAVLWNPPIQLVNLKEMEATARALGIQLQLQEAPEGKDLDSAFSLMNRGHAGAVLVLGGPMFASLRKQIAQLAANRRLPAMYPQSLYVDDGGLMSYGTNFADLYRHAVTYVDKILKGAKPADLPVEQPTKFEFVINLKAAKQIGLTIPPNVLARADKVIR